jgi:hypothetical protein
VLLRRDSAADPLLRPYRPILHKGPRALDRRLVHALTGIDVKGTLTLDGEVALLRPRLVGSQLGIAIEDVVFWVLLGCVVQKGRLQKVPMRGFLVQP